MKRLQRFVAMLLVIALSFSTINVTAAAEMFKLPAQLKVIEQEAFYATSVTKMQIPDVVETIENRAFASCTQLYSVYFPNHDIVIADDAFNGSDSVCFYVYPNTSAEVYAQEHDIPVVHLADELTINSVTADTTETEVGRTITWTVQTSGVEQRAYYGYSLYIDGLLVEESEYTTRNYYTYPAGTPGNYTMMVSCYDAGGITIEASADVVVVNRKPSSIVSVSRTDDTLVEGGTLSWAFELSAPSEAAVFAVCLTKDGEIVAEESGLTDATYSYGNTTIGEYVLTVQCEDGTLSSSAISLPAVIYSQEEVYPEAPVLIPASDFELPSQAQATAPSYPVDESVYIAWDSIALAQSYGVELFKQVGTEWISVYKENDIAENKVTFAKELFTAGAESVLYRLSVCSNGIAQGEASHWYFKIEPDVIDESITVNGLEKVYWDQVARKANRRYFTVEAELPWTATTDVEWLTVTTDEDGLTVYMAESNLSTSAATRTGNVLIFNGVNTATIVVNQDSLIEGATINMPWSTNENAPTSYPVGGVFLDVDSNAQEELLRILEKKSNGSYVCVYETFIIDDDWVIPATVNGYTFKANTTYCFEFSGHVSSDRYLTAELEEDAIYSRYYVHMEPDGHSLMVDEKADQSLILNGETNARKVKASNLWTAYTDVDWLEVTESGAPFDNAYFKTTKYNYTGKERTGHVTFVCGTAEVVVTVTQPDSTPRIIMPTTISQSEKSPTSLAYNIFAYEMIGDSTVWEAYENGAYVSTEITATAQIGTAMIRVDTSVFSPNIRYRITVANDDGSKAYYYVKFSGDVADEDYISFKNYDGSYSYDAKGAGETITGKLNVSGKWSAVSQASWLTLSATSGTKSGNVSITVAPNRTGSMRSGYVIFTCGTSKLYVQVNQDSLAPYFAIYNDSLDVISTHTYKLDAQDASEHDEKLKIYAYDTWTATSDSDWLTFTTASKTITVEMAKNPVGGSVRTGTITLTCGTEKRYIEVTQYPYIAAPVTYGFDFATSEDNPGVIPKQDVTFYWDHVEGAFEYEVFLRLSKWCYYYVPADGRDTYSFTIPQEWFTAADDKDYSFSVSSIAPQTTSAEGTGHYFYAIAGDAVYVDNSTDPVWENATDLETNRTFNVSANTSWTAQTSEEWIALDKSSGSSVDTLTVTLTPNIGGAREGEVIVSCGSAATTIKIQQCAVLSEYPEVTSPVYSQDRMNPTLVLPGEDSLTVTWESAPQARYYRVSLTEMDTQSKWSSVADSGNLYDGEESYTFRDLQLNEGALYRLKLTRRCERVDNYTRSTYCYFQIIDGESYVFSSNSQGDHTTDEHYPDGSEEHFYRIIKSSGVWSAETDVDWLMVGSKYIDQAYLDEKGYTTADYSSYLGQPNTTLYISALQNDVKAVREGKITLRCGTATAEILVYQEPYYKLAEITSPVLGESSSDEVQWSHTDLNLKWSEAEGGNGSYIIVLERKGENGRYEEVYRKTVTNVRSHTIPAAKFEEKGSYKLLLFSGVEGLPKDEWSGERYYFYVKSKDELTLNADVDWSKAGLNGSVRIDASATGGTGGYDFAYELLCEGEQETVTEWGSWANYTFPLLKAGTYQVRTYVMDRSGEQSSSLSEKYVVSGEVVDSISLSRGSWAVDPLGDSTNITVYASGNWTVASDKSWVTVQKSGSATAKLTCSGNGTTSSRSANVTFSCGTASVVLSVIQNSYYNDSQTTLSISQNTWDISFYEAAELELSIETDAAWNVSANPEWVSVSQDAGQGDARVTLTADANSGAARSGMVVFSTENDSCTLVISQSGNEIAPRVISVSTLNTEPLTGEEVVFEVVTENASHVQLVVDSKAYETYEVVDDVATVKRAFSIGGNRKVQFIPLRDTAAGKFSDVITLDITSYGQLDNPQIRPTANTFANFGFVASWAPVENAQSYTLYWKLNDEVLYQKKNITENNAVVPGWAMTEEGSYLLVVCAVAQGYDQGDAACIVAVNTKELTTLSGRVLDSDGDPIEGVDVIIKDENTSTYAVRGKSTERVVTTDENGLWYWENAVIGAAYSIAFEKEGFVFDTILNVVLDTIWDVITAPVYAQNNGNTTVSANNTLTGTITTADGQAVPGINVTVTKSDNSYSRMSTTDRNGKWGVSLPNENATYVVEYSQSLLTVSPAMESVTLSKDDTKQLTAIAMPLGNGASSEISFTMDSDTILVGETVTFDITVPGDAVKARLIVDGIPYDVVQVADGHGTLTRKFTSSGTRNIAFQIARNGAWEAMSKTQTLNITSNGRLAAPVYADVEKHYTGDELALDWQDVANADEYVIRLYRGGVVRNEWTVNESKLTIDAMYFDVAGQHSVSVMATGIGYDQNGKDDLFEVVLRNYQSTMTVSTTGSTVIIGDEIDVDINQSGGGYVAVMVTEPSGKSEWLPQDANGMVQASGDAHIQLSIPVTQTGDYTIRPYIFPIQDIATGIKPVKIESAVKVKVSGPSISQIQPAHQIATWVYDYEATGVTVITNNAVDCVEVYENNVLIGSVSGLDFPENQYVRTFAVPITPITTKGQHTIKVVAKDTVNNHETNLSKSFYVVEPISNGKTVYPQAANITMYSSPLNGKTKKTLDGQTNLDKLTIIGDAATWYQVRTNDGVEGFVKYAQVSEKPWSGASGQIVFTCPPADMKHPIWKAHYLQFDWTCGVAVPDGAKFTLDIKGLTSGVSITQTVEDRQALVLMDKFKDDGYTAVVSLKHNGKTLATSAVLNFTMGDFSLEDSYREWWKNTIAPMYEEYMLMDAPFNGKSTKWHGWWSEELEWHFTGYMDFEIKNAARPLIVTEAATLAYMQVLNDFYDLAKDATTNAESNSILVGMDAKGAMRRSMLRTISYAMLRETEKGSMKLDPELSNIDPVANANQHVALADAQTNAVFAGLRGAVGTLSISWTTYSSLPSNKVPDELADAGDQIFTILGEMLVALEDAMKEVFAEYDAQAVLDAYAADYANLLRGGCETYVEYLKAVYDVDNVTTPNVYEVYVQEYISAFENAAASMGDERKIAEIAEEMAYGLGYTPGQIKNSHDTMLQKIANKFTEEFCTRMLIRTLNDVIKAFLEIKGITFQPDIFTYDAEANPPIGFNAKSISEVGWETVLSGLMGAEADMISEESVFIDYAKALVAKELRDDPSMQEEITKRGKEMYEERVEEVDRGGILKKALKLAHDSFNLGITLEELQTAVAVMNENKNNKGVFDTYGLQLINALRLRLDVEEKAELHKAPGNDIQRMELIRKALVDLTNYDSVMMNNYRNMRLINDNNGNKFDYDLEWLSLEEIDKRIRWIAQYRGIFMSRPAVYDSLFPQP